MNGQLDWGDGRYNCYKASLGKGLLQMTVVWDSDRNTGDSGYRVTVRGRTDISLKRLIRDLDEAKQAAVELAERYVNMMKAEIDALFLTAAEQGQ